jgi:hypothetical protein
MTSFVAEYTSHRHPEIIRVQLETRSQILGGFVVWESDVEIVYHSIWKLIDEALVQNTRYFAQKPIKLFLLQFDESLRIKVFETIAYSENELRFRSKILPPQPLVKAARRIAERHIPQTLAVLED